MIAENYRPAVDLRREAEDRLNISISAFSNSSSSDLGARPRPTSVRSRTARLNPVINLEPSENLTPHIAKIAEKDYLLNGSRARAESGEFIPPRWIPDLATTHCTNCHSEFDWINRRHHCRHCGQIFCERCANQTLLLPPEFGYRDPERVCVRCYDQLLPLQSYFSTNIANHQRANTVDIASDSCNVRRYFNMPVATTLGSEIRKASYTVHNLLAPQAIRDNAIPLRLIREAKGLAFLTIFKGGFGVGAKFGTGLVIARLPREQGGGWSAPSAIGVMGLTWGFMIGADLTDTLIVLYTDEAVRAFTGNAQLTIGADIEVAVGMVGRSGSAEVHLADTQTLAPAFSYSQSKGLYAGISLDGSVLVTRSDVNHKFYGRPVDSQQLLSGELPSPRAAAPLYSALAEALAAVPDVTHRPPSNTASPAALRDHQMRHCLRAQEVAPSSIHLSGRAPQYSVQALDSNYPPPTKISTSNYQISHANNASISRTNNLINNHVPIYNNNNAASANNHHSSNNASSTFSFAEFWASFFDESSSSNSTHYAHLSSQPHPSLVQSRFPLSDNEDSMNMPPSGYAGYEGMLGESSQSFAMHQN